MPGGGQTFAVASGTPDMQDIAEAKAAGGTAWVSATGASPEELDRMASVFEVHPLTGIVLVHFGRRGWL